MTTFSIVPNTTPAKSHPRLSLRKVLYTKFLRWVDEATFHKLKKYLVRTCGTVLFFSLFLAYSFTTGMLLAILQWNEYRIPIAILIFLLIINAKKLRRFKRRRKGNAHTFHGLPVDELASYLLDHGFKRDHAMKKLGISKGKYEKVAEILDNAKVLTRDDNNGRILNNISREDLVRQLRDGFPLVFHRDEWNERDGSWATYLRDQETKEKKEVEKVERLERRATKAEQRIESAFKHRHLFA